MRRYDLLYDCYAEFDTKRLREYQRFIDVFPPIDSRVALEHWEQASEELERRKEAIASDSPGGRPLAEIVARATRQQAFTALDLYTKYGREVEVLILDVDETLRSAGSTDNEIPRSTLSAIQDFHDAGVPIVICTGQTLENVKGFAIQGFGASMVQSGQLSIVYEAGTGVFTPGHGTETKRLLYEGLDEAIVEIFSVIRSRVLREAPSEIRRGCHLQGNEFNVTLKPNFETGSDQARDIIDQGLVHLLELIGQIVGEGEDGPEMARSYYASEDREIAMVLERQHVSYDPSRAIPDAISETFDRIDVAYYEGDAAEIGSRELNKVVGVKSAFEVLGLEEPFAAVLGDSKSDLRVMHWLAAADRGIAAAPEHASEAVLEHVRDSDDLVFTRGRSVDVFRILDAMNRLAALEA